MKSSVDPLFTLFGTTNLQRDIALMDRVKEKFGLKSDRLLAEMIGANKTVLSEIRSYAKNLEQGEHIAVKPRALTALQRLRAFDHLGYAWARDAMIAVFSDEVRNELLNNDNARTQANVADAPVERRSRPRARSGRA